MDQQILITFIHPGTEIEQSMTWILYWAWWWPPALDNNLWHEIITYHMQWKVLSQNFSFWQYYVAATCKVDYILPSMLQSCKVRTAAANNMASSYCCTTLHNHGTQICNIGTMGSEKGCEALNQIKLGMFSWFVVKSTGPLEPMDISLLQNYIRCIIR